MASSRRREVTEIGEGATGFSGELERKYRTRLAQQTLMVNELYLSTVYRPTAGVAAGPGPSAYRPATPGRGGAGR